MSGGICAGLTVVEGGDGNVAAALIGMVLADNGARVVKLEPPAGDRLRTANPNGFRVWSRGKESVVCDLGSEEGREAARVWASACDVLLDGWPNGAAESWGLGHDDLSAANEGLVTCAIRGFASSGPYARIPAVESLVAAKAGKFWDPATGTVRYANELLGSHGATQAGVSSILAALIVRDRTGRGQRVEVNLYEGLSVFDYMGVGLTQGLRRAEAAAAADRSAGSPVAPPPIQISRNVFMPCTKDGRWAVFCAMLPHQVQAITRVCGVGHLMDDPRFASAPVFASEGDVDAFDRHLWDAVRELTAAELMARLLDEPDAACEIAGSTVDAMDHPQVLHNGHVAVVEDAEHGPIEQLGPVARFGASPSVIGRGAPVLGASSDATPPARASTGGKEVLPAHPLAGVTIVEFGYFYAMPNAMAMAAALGARVIKIEDRRGDPQRWSFKIREGGSSKVMEGKESLAIDLRRPEGQAVVHRILRDADAFVCGFRAGVADRMNLGYDVLHRLNPRLVYLHAGGYGVDGPFASRAMYAPTATAIGGGFARQSGSWIDPARAAGLSTDEIRNDLAPRITSQGSGDAHASLCVFTALVLALFHQHRTGEGQFVGTTMINGSLYASADDFLRFPGRAPAPVLDDEAHGLGPLDRWYPAAEGHVALTVQTDEQRRALASVLGRPELASGPPDEEALAAAFLERPAQAWEDALLDAGVPCVRVTETSPSLFTIEDEGLRASGLTFEVDDPAFGRVVRHGPPAAFSLTPPRIEPCCLAGQHTVAILREHGYDDAEIRALQDAGVVFDEQACNAG